MRKTDRAKGPIIFESSDEESVRSDKPIVIGPENIFTPKAEPKKIELKTEEKKP